MANKLQIRVNGQVRSVSATPDTPLLYVLRNEFHLHGPRFGCGLAQCGACTVHIDGKPVRSCVTPVAGALDKPVTTLEGLGTVAKPHPVQTAFIDNQAAQCGYCSNGMIMASAALLKTTPRPTLEQIQKAMTPYICRCGTHHRIVAAIQQASKAMA
jgi:nicotinate dehydrogenase subunit A